MHGNTHTLTGQTHIHTIPKPWGGKHVEKEEHRIGGSCFLLCKWLKHTARRATTHTHKHTDGEDSDQIEWEGNLCGDCPVLQTSNTHTHTHTSNSSNWRCQQQICTHLSQLLQQTQTFSLEWALWHASECLNAACDCVCLCMHVWGFTNVVQKNMESSDWFSDPRIGSFPFSDWLQTTASTQRRQKKQGHI